MKKINILTTISLLSTTSLIVLSSQCKASDTKEKQQKVDDETNNVSNQKDKVTHEPSVEEKQSDNDKSPSNVQDTTNKEITNDKIKLPKGAYYSNEGNDNKYYQALEGLSGIELYNKLHQIQRANSENIPDYNSLMNTYKDAFKDLYYEKDNSVLDIYSENPSGKDPYTYRSFSRFGSSARNEGQGFNREHIVVQSWFSKSSPMRNDAHHVWPTDIKVNNLRDRLIHSNVPKPSKTSQNGTKIDSNHAEVIDEFKGDVARAYFYFAATYIGTRNWLKKEGAQAFDFSEGALKNQYFKVFKQWSDKDKIDAFDIVRNNEIAKHQVVRNPFSDYPELIDLILDPQGKVFKNRGVLKINLDKYFEK
ncbi:endonuclease [Mycoplasma tauri]|uniref:endonuclease n=1 Tax=Mycoplasma tauri TaxID=547987 RepID=UPI001CBD03E1|nr:endonuclease [Mycoplasma tauri]MBZ4218422.1 endonuclease [Mycoplasma tauri]